MLLSTIDPECHQAIFDHLFEGGQIEHQPHQGMSREEWAESVEEVISIDGLEEYNLEVAEVMEVIQANLIMDPRLGELRSDEREDLMEGAKKRFANEETAEMAITGALAFLFKGVIDRENRSLTDLEEMIDTAKALSIVNPPPDLSEEDELERKAWLIEWLEQTECA